VLAEPLYTDGIGRDEVSTEGVFRSGTREAGGKLASLIPL
jgi:hypothetical protein